MSPATSIVRLVLVGEANHLRALGPTNHPAGHQGTGELVGRGEDTGAIDHENGNEVDGAALIDAKEFDINRVALGHAVLLAAG